MSIMIASSTGGTVTDVIEDIGRQLRGIDPRMLIYFASSIFAPEAISAGMQSAFEGAVVFGCSSSGEIVSGGMLKNSVVAMAFDSRSIQDARVEVLEDLNEADTVDKAFDVFGNYFNMPVHDMEPATYVGIVLVDGLSGAEEKLIDRMGDLTHVTFIGGSAGDDLKLESTYVFANGRSYGNAALLALLKPCAPFTFIKTQSFLDLGKKLVVTRANEASREVIEFNNKPAVLSYAEALGVSPDEAPARFMRNPVGLMIENEPFVRSPQRVKGDSMFFYCAVTEGMELSLLESTGIVEDTAAALTRVQNDFGSVSGIILFNCILRTLELEQKGLTSQYGELFRDIPTIGFSTYGEQYIGHINQTATMLLFK